MLRGKPTEAQVEACAIFLYNQTFLRMDGWKVSDWNLMAEHQKEPFREDAHALFTRLAYVAHKK